MLICITVMSVVTFPFSFLIILIWALAFIFCLMSLTKGLLLFSCSVMSNSLQPMDCCTPGFLVLHYFLKFAQIHVHSVDDAIRPSYPLSLPFSSCPQSFKVSGLFQWFGSSHQVAKILASASVLPMNIKDRFPLGLTGLISLQSKWLSTVFPSTTVQKDQFFGSQPSLWSNSHICM